MAYSDVLFFSRTATALGLDLPAEFVRARDLLQAGMNTAASQPTNELLAAFETGDLTTDTIGTELRRTAVDLAAQKLAHEVMRSIELPISRAATKAVRDHGDALIEQMRPVFDSAAAEVAAAASLFSATASAADVLRAGPEAASAWNSLADAAARLERVHDVRVTMANFGYGASPHRPAYFVAGISTQDEMIQATAAYSNSSGRGGRFHALAAAGCKLRLNTAGEVAAINEAIQSDVSAITAGRQAGPRMTPEQQAGAERELRIRASVPVPVPMKAKARA